ncbi:MAG TPA: MAPEG family protein [Rhizomicrobium sp.]|nr:MAPEG family protein [Rhizomicrobium sp.]
MPMALVPHSIIALVLYALWAIALVVMILADRALMIASGKVPATSFTAGVPHGSDSYWRINRAQLNTVENLPIFGAVVLAGWAAGMETHLFNLLAVIVVCARIVQSLIHITSGSPMAINLRFTAYAVQLVCIAWMGVLVVLHAAMF